MKRFLLFFLLPIILLFNSCKKDEEIVKNEEDRDPASSQNQIIGRVQKGPFSVGSTISLYELLPSLSPTGRVFESQIKDNRGNFQISNVFLTSSFVKLRADGFYFNEITGAQSVSQITLNCLSNISDKSTINVNLISHLEKPRIEYLISKGVSFNNAKKQAEQEVLKIFNINKPDIPASELLDITHNGDDNAILLAVSVILQGYRTEGELSNLLASISYDLSSDGALSDSTLGTALINDAKYLKLPEIRQNINARWSALGITDSIPNFEKYVNNFIQTTPYKFTNFITYPNSGMYGMNFLNTTDTLYNPGLNSITAYLPRGASLKIVGSFSMMQGMQDGWSWVSGGNPMVQVSNKSGLICMASNIPSQSGYIQIYENGAIVPTRIKHIYLK